MLSIALKYLKESYYEKENRKISEVAYRYSRCCDYFGRNVRLFFRYNRRKISRSVEKENSSETFLTIYDDGTYEQAHAYGTGRWTIVNGNVLKLTDFYGSSDTYELAEVSNDTIVLKNGRKWLKIGNI